MKVFVRCVLVGAALSLFVVSCNDTIGPAEVAALPSIANYQAWAHLDTQGFVPGHGRSYRRIYVNPTVQMAAGAPVLPVGAVIVKEIYALEAEGAGARPGELHEVEIMRRPAAAPAGFALEEGWLFTTRAKDGGETYGATCYPTCHRQAPRQGVFLDYTKALP
jgi:Cytochrome P460